MTKRRRRDTFRIGLVIYALVLLLLTCFGLHTLRDYLTAYEASQSSHCLDAYRQQMTAAPPAAAEAALQDLYPGIHSREENIRFIGELLAGARLMKNQSLSSEDKLVYAVKAEDGNQLGTVTLKVVSRDSYSLPTWEVTEEHYDFSPYYQTEEISVPSDYTVCLGDRILGPDAITERDIPYQALADYYPLYENLPYMVQYRGGPYLGDAKLSVLDENGTAVAQEDWNESHYLDRCAPEIREKVDAYVPEFLYLYVNFSGDAHRTAQKYYNQIKPLLVPGGELQDRLEKALVNYGFARTESVKILSTDIHSVTPLGDDRYLVDLTYETEVTGTSDPVVITDNIHLVLFLKNGKLLADSLYIY